MSEYQAMPLCWLNWKCPVATGCSVSYPCYAQRTCAPDGTLYFRRKACGEGAKASSVSTWPDEAALCRACLRPCCGWHAQWHRLSHTAATPHAEYWQPTSCVATHSRGALCCRQGTLYTSVWKNNIRGCAGRWLCAYAQLTASRSRNADALPKDNGRGQPASQSDDKDGRYQAKILYCRQDMPGRSWHHRVSWPYVCSFPEQGCR